MLIRTTVISAGQTYREAFSLYADSELSIKAICERVGAAVSAFSSELYKHHRDFVLQRHNSAETLHLYETTPELLKSIASRLRITYNRL